MEPLKIHFHLFSILSIFWSTPCGISIIIFSKFYFFLITISVQGYWGAWVEDQTCSLVGAQCQRNRVRTCSNPAPKNDANACGTNGASQTEVIPCLTSQCSRKLDYQIYLHSTISFGTS